MRKKDLTGKRFGRLVVICEGAPVYRRSGRKCVTWKCKCDCGNYITVVADQLGVRTNSCGCLSRERISAMHRTHGQTGTRLFVIWMDMKQRCTNRNNSCYERYGGRGIGICDEWLNFSVFMDWANKNGYKDDLTIERIDVNGDYCPANCTWIPAKDQAKNRRSSRIYSFNGKTMCLTDWSKALDISFWALRARLNKGWDVEKAFTTPVRKCKRA